MAIDVNDPKLIDKVVQMGMFAYTLEQAINILDVSDGEVKDFSKAWNDPRSKVSAAYRKGTDKRMLQFDVALMASAKKGNLEAMRELEHRIKTRAEKGKS